MSNQNHSPNHSHPLRRILAVALLTALASSVALAQSNADEQELIKLDKEWSAALELGDRDALNRIMADDFTSRGGAENRAQYLERISKRNADDAVNLKNGSSVPSNYAVNFKGGEMAVMSHITVGKGEYKGKSFTDYSRSLHVWMKRGGRWQVVASEGAPLPDGQVLRLIEREWGEAIKNKDKAWFERAFADEYTSINSRGKMVNKTEDIADALSNTDTITSDELSNMKVRVSGDAATVIGRLHLVGKDKTGNFDRNYMFTDTFIRRDGRWQVVSTQATLVAPETTAMK
ncbi:MAG: nuclear transport factor 2 family protein [Acidobacteriota bacterium]|nr:nuclear transport factor 2 family protein [Acidobacteriota bacterium]